MKGSLRKSTRKKIKQRKAVDVRWNTKLWYPSAADLQLPDLPENLRPEARLVLDRALPKMFQHGVGIQSGKCWRIAQALAIAADEELGYVEGVWMRSPNNSWSNSDDAINPVPHGWNSFHGHIVDLVAEFYNWNSFGEDAPWLHEPLKEYSLQDLRNFEEEFGGIRELPGDAEVYSISPVICIEGSDGYFSNFDFGLNDPDPVGSFIEDGSFVFRPARERLLARLNLVEAASEREFNAPART